MILNNRKVHVPKTFLYVSNWTHFGGQPGIGVFDFDEETGSLRFIKMANTGLSCGMSLADPENGLLYVANETENNPVFRAGGGGRIYCFSVDPETGTLTESGHVDTLCPNPTYFSLDPSRKWMVAANHSGGNPATVIEHWEDGQYRARLVYSDAAVELFSVKENGVLEALVDVVKHTGNGPGRKQLCAHPHSAVLSPSGKLFAVADKGNDTIRFYQIQGRKLVQKGHTYHLPAGSEARYLLFHPTRPYFYVNHERCNAVRCFRYTEEGEIELQAEIGVFSENIQAGPKGEGQGFRITQDGKYIYMAYHDPCMIAVFRTEEDGTLTLLQNKMVPVEWLRGLTLSPDERFLVVSGMTDGKILVYQIHEDGLLTDTGITAEQSAPAYLTFYRC